MNKKTLIIVFFIVGIIAAAVIAVAFIIKNQDKEKKDSPLISDAESIIDTDQHLVACDKIKDQERKDWFYNRLKFNISE